MNTLLDNYTFPYLPFEVCDNLFHLQIEPKYKKDGKFDNYFLLTATAQKECDSNKTKFRMQLHYTLGDVEKIRDNHASPSNHLIICGMIDGINIKLVKNIRNSDGSCSTINYPEQNPIGININSINEHVEKHNLRPFLGICEVEKLSNIQINPVHVNGKLESYFILTASRNNGEKTKQILELWDEERPNIGIGKDIIYGIASGGCVKLMRKPYYGGLDIPFVPISSEY